tara:strand:+ start:304 stop:1155 length:852 start_codon:yes stop_codon:yes gene_type:complete
MSNELMNMPDFLSPAAVQSELDAQAELVNPAALFPKMRLNKDVRGFMITMGEQNLGTPSEVQFLILGLENLYGSRALFPPSGMGGTTPVCATRLLNPSKKPWIGKWNNDSGFPNPVEGEHVCGKCPWSQFGSDPKWDDTKKGKGPACKERRVIYGIKVEESERRGMFKVVDDTVIQFVLPATSIRTTKSMVAKATAAKIPLSAACFLLSAKMHTRGSIKWCTLEAELIGVLGDKASYARVQELRKKVSNIVGGSEELDTTPYSETSATSNDINSSVEDDVIPF